jgi:hypothetical protein
LLDQVQKSFAAAADSLDSIALFLSERAKLTG